MGDDWSVQHWVETKHNRLARQFFSMAKQGGWFHHLSGADQAAIQFNIPVGVDLAENIRISESGDASILISAAAHSFGGPIAGSLITAYGPWFARVFPRQSDRIPTIGVWDYKARVDDHEMYQDFGNFNFGMTGAAEGISLDVLLRGGGAVQFLTDLRHGRPGPAGQPLFSDHPRDIAMVKLGYAFYAAMQLCSGHGEGCLSQGWIVGCDFFRWDCFGVWLQVDFLLTISIQWGPPMIKSTGWFPSGLWPPLV